MNQPEVAAWIQVAAIVVASSAAVAALVSSRNDRKDAQAIASLDRHHASRQAMLLFELDALVRLLENRNAGGSSIPAEAARLGAESVSLVGIIGESRIPRQWGRQVGDEQHLRPLLEDENFPQYKRDAIEVQLAVNAVTAELRDLLQPPQREI